MAQLCNQPFCMSCMLGWQVGSIGGIHLEQNTTDTLTTLYRYSTNTLPSSTIGCSSSLVAAAVWPQDQHTTNGGPPSFSTLKMKFWLNPDSESPHHVSGRAKFQLSLEAAAAAAWEGLAPTTILRAYTAPSWLLPCPQYKCRLLCKIFESDHFID